MSGSCKCLACLKRSLLFRLTYYKSGTQSKWENKPEQGFQGELLEQGWLLPPSPLCWVSLMLPGSPGYSPS